MNSSTIPPPTRRTPHHTSSLRSGPTTTFKAPLIDVLPSQQPAKSSKNHSAKRTSAPVKHQESQGTEEASVSLQKKKPNRSARKALSTGSLVDVKASKSLSQESVVILKRGDGKDLSDFLASPFAGSREEESSHTHGSDASNRTGSAKQTRSRDSSPSRRRNLQPPSKSRRAQRRKDVEAMREDLKNSEADILSSSPPRPSGSTSSGESSDDVTMINGNEKVVTVPKTTDSKRRRKRERVASSPATSINISAFPPLTATPAIEKSTAAEETKRVTFARPAHQTRRGSSPAIEIKHYLAHATSISAPSSTTIVADNHHAKPTSRVPPASSSTTQPLVKPSPLYAGPTFSNSPAPDALPLPSFQSRSLGESSPLSSGSFRTPSPPLAPTSQRARTISATSFLVQHQARRAGFEMDEDIFGMDNVSETYAPPIYSHGHHHHQRTNSRDLLGLLSTSMTVPPPQSKPVAPAVSFAGPRVAMSSSAVFHGPGYHLPPKMMTSHPPQNGLTREMTASLRSMLKIE